jgi:hypothetical protein
MKRTLKREMPFKTALTSATKRLGKATKERTEAQKRLLALDVEIPALQSTIQALQRQLKPGVVVSPPMVAAFIKADSTVPLELAKFVGPQDLTGMGSITHDPSKPRQLSEDELLPPIEGTPLTPDA